MFGSYQAPSNTVYFDADANQYYTLNNGAHAGFNNYFMGNPMLSGVAQGQRNYLGAVLGGANNKSMVEEMMANKTPYQYNVPSLASLFPSLQGQMQEQAPMQGNAGAGRFMGGLLNSMPTPVSSTTTQAPSTSGAGRFL